MYPTDIEDLGRLARVTYINDEKTSLYFRYLSGGTGHATFSLPRNEFSADALLLVDAENDEIELAPPELVPPDATSVGVVKLKLDDVTIVDQGVQLHQIPTTPEAPAYDEGNTVEFSAKGVQRKLHDRPLRLIEIDTKEDSPEQIASLFRMPTQKLDYSEIGGLDSIIDRARELIDFPISKREHFKKIGIRPPSGVLFTGPPGTGKTMLARTIASQAGAVFYTINGPEVVSKWVGQSEKILRSIFQDAKTEDRSIIFFDEIDSIASKRTDDSHDSTRRLVATLLTLIDGFEENEGLTVIAATNRANDLDPALRRPGRFDSELHFPYPDESGRLDILVKTSRNKNIASNLPFEKVAAKTSKWSGAEITSIWTEAALFAVADNRDKILTEDLLSGLHRVSEYRRKK